MGILSPQSPHLPVLTTFINFDWQWPWQWQVLFRVLVNVGEGRLMEEVQISSSHWTIMDFYKPTKLSLLVGIHLLSWSHPLQFDLLDSGYTNCSNGTDLIVSRWLVFPLKTAKQGQWSAIMWLWGMWWLPDVTSVGCPHKFRLLVLCISLSLSLFLSPALSLSLSLPLSLPLSPPLFLSLGLPAIPCNKISTLWLS